MTTWPPGDNGPVPGNTALGPGGDDFSTGFVTSGTPEVRATLAEWIDYLLSSIPGASGTVDVGTASHVAYYPASTAEVGSAAYVAIGAGSAAGVLVLGSAASHSGGIIMSDAVSNASGTLLVLSGVAALIGSSGTSTTAGTSLAFTAGSASGTGNGGDVTFTLGTTSGGSRNGQFEVVNLPTADPAVTNAIWSDGGVLVKSGHTAPPTGFLIEVMCNEYSTATQFGTFDVGPMPFAGTIDNGYGRAGPAGGTISVTSYIGANSGGVLTFGTITGLSGVTINNGTTIQTGTATAANTFAVGDYVRAIWSQTSGSSTGSLWSITGRKS